jgi:hypothetical protein
MKVLSTKTNGCDGCAFAMAMAGYIDQTKCWVCGRLYPNELEPGGCRGQMNQLKSEQGDGL